MRFELLATDVVQERLSHLAAGAVMNANEQDLFLCHMSKPNLARLGWGATAVFLAHTTAGRQSEPSAEYRCDEVKPKVLRM